MKRTNLWAGMSLCLISNVALADVIWTSGAGTVVAPPMSMEVGALEGATTIYAINERQDIALPYDLAVDWAGHGMLGGTASLRGHVIPAGTRISSHLIHMDTDTNIKMLVEASFGFDGPILGIIVTRSRLVATDVDLGLATTLYSLSPYRGVEIDAFDRVAVDMETNSVWVRLQQSTEIDEVRVITGVIPAPGSLALLSATGLLAGRRRR